MKIVLAIAALVAVSHAYGAPKPAKTLAETPMSPDLSALPHGFKGNKCGVIAARLAKIDAKKSEFETTEHFQARLEAMKSLEISGTVTMGSVVAFATDIEADKVSYDADSGVLEIRYASPLISNLANFDISVGFVSELKETSSRVYEASNAYGRKTRVKQTMYEGCAVGFPNFVRLDQYGAGKSIKREMNPADAKDTKSNLAALYVGKLVAPYSIKYEYYSKPTFDYPYESARTGQMILMNVDQTWIYNKKTGAILDKF